MPQPPTASLRQYLLSYEFGFSKTIVNKEDLYVYGFRR